jgi:GNAT superfamily N-acetyltransferase
MSETLILNYTESFLPQVSEIFFEASTKKDFKDQIEKDAFFWKYVGFYLVNFPEYAWIAVNDGKVLGYVLGMPRTQDPDLYAIQPHLKAFEEHFKLYPAHLHVNCHIDARGKGVGRKLVLRLLTQLKAQGISGLHIMTGLTSDNKIFYQKLGFDFEIAKNSILLMGIRL